MIHLHIEYCLNLKPILVWDSTLFQLSPKLYDEKYILADFKCSEP